MTPRENLLTVLRCRPADWMPASIHLISTNNLPGHLPATMLDGPLDPLEVARFVGGDVLYEARGVAAEVDPSVTTRTECDGPRRCTTIDTPAGRLVGETTSTEVPTPTVEPLPPGHAVPGPLVTSTHSAFMVKSVDDYAALDAMAEATTYRADRQALAGELRRLGDDGVMVIGGGPGSPLYRLVESLVGIERFSYHLMDHPDVVQRTMTALHEQACRWYRAAAEAPGDAVRCTEDLDTKLVSPGWFTRFAVGCLADYARICHEAGKLFVIHMCGHINAFLEQVRDLPADAIHCVSPPPAGNTTPGRAMQALEGRCAAMLRFDASTLLGGTPEQIDRAVDELVGQVDGRPGAMVIMPCGRAPLANIRRVISRVHHFTGHG